MGTATRTSTYFLTYPVPADGRYEALMKAGAMLRQSVRVVGEAEAEQGVPGWWNVTFLVAEDYPSPVHENHSQDPEEGPSASACPTCMGIDHAPDATVESEYARP